MLTKAIRFQFFVYQVIQNTDRTKKGGNQKMAKKLIVLAVFFVALCFAGGGCLPPPPGVVHGGQYYDGPYRSDGRDYYYSNGEFYAHDGDEYRFHHQAPQEKRGYYDKRYQKNNEKYRRKHPESRY